MVCCYVSEGLLRVMVVCLLSSLVAFERLRLWKSPAYLKLGSKRGGPGLLLNSADRALAVALSHALVALALGQYRYP